MVWLSGFIALFMALTGYFLFAPFYLEVNSKTGLLQFRFHKLGSVRLILMNNTLVLAIKIAWWTKQVHLLQPGERKKEKVIIKAKKSPGRQIPVRKMIGVIKSFSIMNCHVKISFDDMAANGIFFPLVFWLGNILDKDISINFENENEIELKIKNTCARMIWAYVKS